MSKDDDDNNIVDFLKEKDRRNLVDEPEGEDFYFDFYFDENIFLQQDNSIESIIKKELAKTRSILESRSRRNYNLMLINILLIMLQLILIFCYTVTITG